MDPIDRRDFLKSGVVGLGATLSPLAATCPSAGEFAFHHDHVIGTSLDLHVIAPDEDAALAAESAMLDEVERLRRVLSPYDPTSELSLVNRASTSVTVSPDLAAVLRAYELWQRTTLGAVSSQVADLARVWKAAAVTGVVPPADALERVVRARGSQSPGWHLDAANTLTRTADTPLDLNALGKAYIIEKATEAVRQKVPAVTGLLLNVGGDILAWGSSTGGGKWTVGVQDPFRHFDNAAPIAGIKLENQAIAGSGGYQRFYSVGGRRFSHVLDPRSGQPAEGVVGATVVAADAVTANALATALCVLQPQEGLRLVAGLSGVGCVIVASDGTQFVSPGLQLLAVTRATAQAQDKRDKKDEKPAEAWPDGYQVVVNLELPKIDAKKYRRPYVAVWLEDEKGKAVRTLGVWGNAPKYLKDLGDWWKVGKNNEDLVKAVARATRGPGKYDLVWDGKDDQGTALPQGTYTVRVEVHREFGAHLRQSGKIDCRDKPADVKLEKNAETGETAVEFKKADKK
jgi:thiamine biosynthesis lipoprotein ApbE